MPRRKVKPVPERMRAVQLSHHDRDLGAAIENLAVVTDPVPRPGRGQVLVKIEAAPCNPSDLLHLQGLYSVKKTLPSVPGWEGAGTLRPVSPSLSWEVRTMRIFMPDHPSPAYLGGYAVKM